MNNKGQSTMLAIVVGIMIFIAGMLFVNPIKDDVTTARAADQMDCGNLSISDGAKVTCLGIDAVVPYFILIVLGAAGGIIFSRIIT